LLLACLAVAGSVSTAGAQEIGMFGNTPSRNMVSGETGVPESWDPSSGTNVLWTQPVGSQAYGGPTVANGKVYVGTNNEGVRNPAYEGDKGVLMAFDAASGDFAWQMVHDKLSAGRVNDWPLQGVCSTAFAEGDKVWYVSNQAHVVCLDANGLANGNDGPFTDETGTGPTDGDILWSYDMIGELDVFPHNMTSSAPAVYGDLVIVNTSNGQDESGYVPSPEAPDLIALNRQTGALVWRAAPVGEWILHGQWSSPAVAEIDGVVQVVIGQGDGWVRGYDVADGMLLWEFDTNPIEAEWPTTRNNVIATPVVWNDMVFVANGQDPESGEGDGRLHAIDATGRGDISESGVVWRTEAIRRSLSTVAIDDGLLYVADFSGYLHCLDVTTGEEVWVYDTFAAVWGSPLVVDGKIYLGDEDGDVVVLRAGRDLEVLAENTLRGLVYGAPVAANGVLYINTVSDLFALEER
jgi:outer membrane protein assembly factor BamB